MIIYTFFYTFLEQSYAKINKVMPKTKNHEGSQSLKYQRKTKKCEVMQQ